MFKQFLTRWSKALSVLQGFMIWLLVAQSGIAQLAVEPFLIDEVSASIPLGEHVIKSMATESQSSQFAQNPEKFLFEQLFPSINSGLNGDTAKFSWQQNSSPEIAVKSPTGSSWLYLELINNSSQTRQYLLAIENVQAASWAVVDTEDNVQFTIANIEAPLLGRVIYDEAFVIPLMLSANEKYRLVISDYTLTSSNVMNLDLWAPESFREARTKQHLAHGVYYGFLIFLFFFCLLFSALQRQIAYLYAAGYQLSIGFLVALMTGLAEIIFFPNSAGLVFPFYMAVFVLTGSFAGLFSLKFLDLKKTNFRIYQFWIVYIWFGFILVPISFYLGLPDNFLMGRSILIVLGLMSLFVGQFLYFHALYLSWGRSKITVVWFIAVVLQYWVVVASQILNSTGFGTQEESRYLVQIFTVIEGSVLCVMLSFLYREEQALAAAAQAESLLNLQIANDVQRSRSEFISMAGHDLRQPLETIKFYLSSLKSSADKAVTATAEKMESNLIELSKLLDSLLSLSRGNSPSDRLDREEFALQDVFEHLTMELLPFVKQKGLSLEIESTALHVHSNEVAFTQILRNLLNNSLKYTHHGYIRVEAELVDQNVIVRVEDSGIGIPKNEQEKIFDEFYQVPSNASPTISGSGLGLSIVARLSRTLDITVAVDSEIGTGTCFELTVPAAGNLAQTNAQETGDSPLSLKGLHVALCGKVRDIGFEAVPLLERWGADVSVWENAEDAVQSFYSGEFQPSMIISDASAFDILKAELIGKSSIRIDQLPVLILYGASGNAKAGLGDMAEFESIGPNDDNPVASEQPHYRIQSALSAGLLRSFIQRSANLT